MSSIAKGSIIAASIACLFAVGAVAAPASAAPPPTASTTTTYDVECTKDNFVGKAQITLTRTSGQATSTVDSYSITRNNGQEGGNKANIRLTTDYNGAYGDYSGTETANSSDSMIQDGKTHTLGLSTVVIENDYRQQKATNVRVQFTFDKSGLDPYCSTPAKAF